VTDRQEFSAEDWAAFLSGQLGREVRVRYGRARRQVIVAYPERSGLRVRMNHAFGRAPHPVRTAVADWLRAGRRARESCERLDDWIASMVATLGPPRVARLAPHGAHHDLAEIAADLLEREFRTLPRERHPAGFTWGRRAPRGVRRSLQLGSFDPETTLIRVHPVLDQPAVPRAFVRYVLFHELLHAELNEPCAPGRRMQHHGREFRRREAAYPGTAPALAWQERHLSALLRSARSGKPMPLPRPEKPRRKPGFVQRLLFE
jgi:hypothetical protein